MPDNLIQIFDVNLEGKVHGATGDTLAGEDNDPIHIRNHAYNKVYNDDIENKENNEKENVKENKEIDEKQNKFKKIKNFISIFYFFLLCIIF